MNRITLLVLLATAAPLAAEPTATDNPEARAALAAYDREVEAAAAVYRLAAARAAAKATKALEAAKVAETKKGRLEVALAIKAKQEVLAAVIAEADPAVARRRAILAGLVGHWELASKAAGPEKRYGPYTITATPDGVRLADMTYGSTRMVWIDDSTLLFDWTSSPGCAHLLRITGETLELTFYTDVPDLKPERPKGSPYSILTVRRVP